VLICRDFVTEKVERCRVVLDGFLIEFNFEEECVMTKEDYKIIGSSLIGALAITTIVILMFAFYSPEEEGGGGITMWDSGATERTGDDGILELSYHIGGQKSFLRVFNSGQPVTVKVSGEDTGPFMFIIKCDQNILDTMSGFEAVFYATKPGEYILEVINQDGSSFVSHGGVEAIVSQFEIIE
jgi:hypothetical protein